MHSLWSPQYADALPRMSNKAAHLSFVNNLQAFVGTAPLLALVSEDLHAHQIRDTRCQPPLDRSLTCSKLRVC